MFSWLMKMLWKNGPCSQGQHKDETVSDDVWMFVVRCKRCGLVRTAVP